MKFALGDWFAALRVVEQRRGGSSLQARCCRLLRRADDASYECMSGMLWGISTVWEHMRAITSVLADLFQVAQTTRALTLLTRVKDSTML